MSRGKFRSLIDRLGGSQLEETPFEQPRISCPLILGVQHAVPTIRIRPTNMIIIMCLCLTDR